MRAITAEVRSAAFGCTYVTIGRLTSGSIVELVVFDEIPCVHAFVFERRSATNLAFAILFIIVGKRKCGAESLAVEIQDRIAVQGRVRGYAYRGSPLQLKSVQVLRFKARSTES